MELPETHVTSLSLIMQASCKGIDYFYANMLKNQAFNPP